MLNTPIAVLAAVVVVAALNGFLFFGYYLPRTTIPPGSPLQGERTTSLEETTVEKTRLRRTSEGTTTSSNTATPTATATSSP